MSKFRIGDKVKCVKPSIYMNLEDGEIYEVLNVSKTTIKVNKKIDSDDWCDDYRFILQEEKEEMKSESFNLKTNPWFIRVNNKAEFEAAISWAEEKGLKWDKIPREYNKIIKAIGTCLSFPQPQVIYYLASHEDIYEGNRLEIKVNFKTVIDHVEYPVVESEQQKKIRELKETIEKASAQIAEIEKEMK